MPPKLDDLDLAATPIGTRLRLRVKPGAKKSAVLGTHGGALKLSVVTPAERGKANRSVLKFLARLLDLPASDIAITAGQSSQDKTVLIPLPPDQVLTRLTNN